MAGTSYAAALARLFELARTGRSLAARTEGWRGRRDAAIEAALDEGVPIMQIARALGITRQSATELVRRVRG